MVGLGASAIDGTQANIRTLVSPGRPTLGRPTPTLLSRRVTGAAGYATDTSTVHVIGGRMDAGVHMRATAYAAYKVPPFTRGSQTVPASPLRQTGAGRMGRSADELYDAIRASTDDVAEIAKYTGIKPENIQKVKNHLFYDEHLLDRYVDIGEPAVIARFDSDMGIARAWERLRTGDFTEADLQLLRHEAAEAKRMRSWGPSYTRAHDAAQNRYPAPNLEGQ